VSYLLHDCHLQGGIAPYASPVVGISQNFPLYSKRAGPAITLEDRIQECIIRSENGKPLPHDSREMKALLAYLNWLSEPHRDQPTFVTNRDELGSGGLCWQGLEVLPALRADPTHGAEVYSAQCAGRG
jgi:thiosulfate dehydrogenase